MYCFFFYIIPPLTTSTFFFFNDTATTEIYTLSLHDALPIYMVEPVKDYTREALAPSEPTSFTPMNRVVDAVPLESDAARRFGELVDKFLAASCHDGATEARLRMQLTAWRDNDAKLQPLMERSFLAKEVAASSRDLSDRKSTRLNSSHLVISYAVFCLKKKTITTTRENSTDPTIDTTTYMVDH